MSESETQITDPVAGTAPEEVEETATESAEVETAPQKAEPEEASPEDLEHERLKAFLQSAGVQMRDVDAIEGELESELAASADAGGDGAPARGRARASGRQAGRRRSGSRQSRRSESRGHLEEVPDEALEITVSDDQLSAMLSVVPPGTMTDEIVRALKAENIRHGISKRTIEAVNDRSALGESLVDVVVARGKAPKQGREGVFAWAVDVGGRAGTIQEDGSIDLRDRRLMVVVQEGDLLGRLLPAQEGKPGTSVFGAEITPLPVRPLKVTAGAGVSEKEEGNGVVAYYAEREAGVSHSEKERVTRQGERRELKIELVAVSHIEKDVDYSTGHVDFSGDVVIDGTVKALFRVKATGTVTIAGDVEPNAHVEAGGDILVSGGVHGQAELVAGGSVMAKFLQRASVQAGGDIEIGSYLFEASVKTGGNLLVGGKGEGSGRAIVGGLAWAAHGIETPSLGSPSNPRLKIVVGIDPAQVTQAEKARAKLRAIEGRERELLGAIGVKRFDPRLIKEKLKSMADAQERATALKQVKKLTELGAAHKHLRQELEQIAKHQQELASKATLKVKGPLFTGPEIRIGRQVLAISEDTRAVCLRLQEEDGKTAIVMNEV